MQCTVLCKCTVSLLLDLIPYEISNGVAVTTTVVGKDWLSLENLNSSFIWEIRTLIIAGKKKERQSFALHHALIALHIRNYDVRRHL